MAYTPPAIGSEVLDADLLRIFCRVAETLNFSRAAAQLGVAQPIVTRKIRRLEEQLGILLFERSNRGCALTHEGELLASRAAGILLQLAQLRTDLSTSAGQVAGTVAVGLPTAPGMLLAPQLLPIVARRWPQLRIEMTEAVSRTLLANVISRELSLALVYDPAPGDGLIARPLLMERLHLVAVPRLAKRLASVRKIRLRDLSELPLILPSRKQVIRNLLEDACAEEGVPLQARFEASSTLLLKAMVLQGLGYAILTLGSLADEVTSGRLVAVPLEEAGMALALTLVTTPEHARLRVVQLVGDLIESETRRLASEGLWPGAPRVMRPARPLTQV